jgi:hypothetical protein
MTSDTGGKFATWVIDTGGKSPIHQNNANNRLLTPLCELEEKLYFDVNSTIQKCPNKIFKTFLIVDFIHLPPVSMTQMVHLELPVSP